MRISAQMLVKNEEKFVWFSIMSVIDYVDEFLIWDDCSTDKTAEMIKILSKKYTKIIYKRIDKSLNQSYTQLRQAMLESTNADWIIIIDGDEIWWKDSILKLINTINSNKTIETIVTRYINCVGDIYHFLPDELGKYEIDEKKGFLTIRAMSKKIPGLHFEKPHGQIGIFDNKGTLIQNRSSKNRIHILKPGYIHTTHLRRSTLENEGKVLKRMQKFKYEIGLSFDLDYFYPESFFYERPDIVDSPWHSRDWKYNLVAFAELPFKKLKRLLPSKSGY